MLLIYTTFVAGWEARRWRGLRLPGPAWIRYLVLMLLVGFLTEALAWIGNFLAREETPALLHPQLLYDLLLSPGIHGAWAVGWILATRRWRFSVAEVFVIQGIYGVFVEQQGAVFLQGWRALPLGVVLWLYVFVVYGAAAGLAYLPVGRAAGGAGPRRALEDPGSLAAAIPGDGDRRHQLGRVLVGPRRRHPRSQADLASALLVSPRLRLCAGPVRISSFGTQRRAWYGAHHRPSGRHATLRAPCPSSRNWKSCARS
jgi:hypothetical protein